uniref:Uncharacterized protein n=1 Tax=Oryza punctata TaxID=4537 RepID=A0A0E0JJM0_ORYPU
MLTSPPPLWSKPGATPPRHPPRRRRSGPNQDESSRQHLPQEVLSISPQEIWSMAQRMRRSAVVFPSPAAVDIASSSLSALWPLRAIAVVPEFPAAVEPSPQNPPLFGLCRPPFAAGELAKLTTKPPSPSNYWKKTETHVVARQVSLDYGEVRVALESPELRQHHADHRPWAVHVEAKAAYFAAEACLRAMHERWALLADGVLSKLSWKRLLVPWKNFTKIENLFVILTSMLVF